MCHSCDNPICVNPAHLFVSDQSGNSADKMSKRREARGERLAKKLSGSAVEEIRSLAASGFVQEVIAARFGVEQSTISRVVHGLRWADRR